METIRPGNKEIAEEAERFAEQVGQDIPAVSGKTAPDFLARFYGIFADDPNLENIVRYSEERRKREREEANRTADEADAREDEADEE